jgi:transcriptional regulator with XRE-family HTH domain
MQYYLHIGPLLPALREKTDLTTEELAMISRIDSELLDNIEKGFKPLSEENLSAISNATRIPIDLFEIMELYYRNMESASSDKRSLFVTVFPNWNEKFLGCMATYYNVPEPEGKLDDEDEPAAQ